jgi:hypothetical protein
MNEKILRILESEIAFLVFNIAVLIIALSPIILLSL